MSSPFSAGLAAKVIDRWMPADYDGTTSWVGADNGTVATAGGAAKPSLVASAFGANTGVRVFPCTQVFTARSYFSLTQLTNVRAAFALVKCNDITTPTLEKNSGVGFICGNNAYNSVEFLGSVDSSRWAEYTSGRLFSESTGAVQNNYMDGVAVGAALSRRTDPHVIGSVTVGNFLVTYLGMSHVSDGTDNTWGPIVLLNAAPTALEIAELNTYLNAYGSFTAPALPSRLAIFMGDSLTECIGGETLTDPNHAWPGIVARSIGLSNLDWTNLGWFGANAVTIAPVSTGIATDTLAATRASKTVVLWVGRNDINAGNSAATIAANIRTLCTNLRTGGARRIILLTIIPSNFGANQTAYDGVRASLNTLILGMVATGHADKVIDLTTLSAFSTNSSYTDTTYYNADGVHKSQTGNNLVAAQFTSSVLFPPSGSGGVVNGNYGVNDAIRIGI
jgi:lysophospholipase L1-like esterase